MYTGPSPFPTAGRLPEINRKHARLVAWLGQQGAEGVLLRCPTNLAWFTTGAPVRETNPAAEFALYIAPESRVVIASEHVARDLFEGPLEGLGFQVKLRGWSEHPQVLLEDLCRERQLAHDLPWHHQPADPGLVHELFRLRTELSAYEQQRARNLGQDLANALEATARTIQPTDQEAEIAGMLAHRLYRRQIVPVEIRVEITRQSEQNPGSSPLRSERPPTGQPPGPADMAPPVLDQPPAPHSESPAPLQAVLVWACGRRDGLHSAASRCLTWGLPTLQQKREFELASFVSAAGRTWLSAGETFEHLWPRLERLCDRHQLGTHWRWPELAYLTGYRPIEQVLRPDSTLPLRPGMLVNWQPSVGWAAVSDSLLIGPTHTEWLTRTSNWPELRVDVGAEQIILPSICSLELVKK